MSRPPPAYPDFVSTSSFAKNKPPLAYVEDETDEPRADNLDPQALQAALRVEMARRKRLERALQREREAAQRETSSGHLNHVSVIRAPRREQPRTVGVLDINHRSGYRRSQACSICCSNVLFHISPQSQSCRIFIIIILVLSPCCWPFLAIWLVHYACHNDDTGGTCRFF